MTTGNETNAGQTWGAPIHSEWDSVTSLVTGGTVLFSEQPRETITQQRGNSLLLVSLNITIFPSQSFSGFRNRGPEPPPGPLAHNGRHFQFVILT